MQIIEYENKFENEIKNLLNQLQKYIVAIDKYKLNTITQEYCDTYLFIVKKQCDENFGKIFLAIKDDKVLGMISGYVYSYNEVDKIDYTCPKKGIISEFVVDREHQNLGVGQELLFFMENYFKNIGCEFIQLDVFAYNDKAINFYVKNQYENRLITMSKKI